MFRAHAESILRTPLAFAENKGTCHQAQHASLWYNTTGCKCNILVYQDEFTPRILMYKGTERTSI